MQRLFDHDVAIPIRPKADPAKARRAVEEAELGSGAPQAIWALLLDRGADPLALAALLRDGVSANERRRAYLELVRDLGAPLAARLRHEVFNTQRALERRSFPVGPRGIVESALAQPLVGINLVTGELVDLLAAKLSTTAFTIGSDVFVGGSVPADSSVLVHEAVHAMQQQGARGQGAPGARTRASEADAHRVLGRLGPLGGVSDYVARERARASVAVRAALGRAPRVSARPLELAAWEPSLPHLEDTVREGRNLAEALTVLLKRGAAAAELKALLGPVDDNHAERVRAVALDELGRRPNATAQLQARLGADGASYLRVKPAAKQGSEGKALPEPLRAFLEDRLGLSLGNVRVHDDHAAAARARALGAIAFTQGEDVYFGAGKYDPESPAGKQLIAHELTHVAQQQGASPAAAGGAQQLSAPGSAVEREADRVAESLAAGRRPERIAERAPAGTISRKDGDAAGGGLKLNVNLLSQQLSLDAGTGVDAGDGSGRKRIDPTTKKFGPVTVREALVKLDGGGAIDSGVLRATVDDGRFKGSLGSLSFDKNGNVTGNLDVKVEVPAAFSKLVKVALGAEGISADVPIALADFLSKELPLKSSAMILKVSSTAGSIVADLAGSAQVTLDAGFASAEGKLTASLSAHGTPTIAAEVAASLAAPGVAGVADAKLKWDGKTIELVGAAKVDVKIPGLTGSAELDYAGGKLNVKIPDLKFAWKALGDKVKWGPLSFDEGKLKGKVALDQDLAIELPGLKLALQQGSTLAIDGDKISGLAKGTIKVGGKTTLFDGKFEFAYNDGLLDGDVTVTKAIVPFLQVEGLKASVKDIGGKNDWTIGGDIKITLLEGKVGGNWKLPKFKGGSLLGDIDFDFKLPNFKLPKIDFSVIEDWKIALPKLPDLKLDLDLGALLGKAGDIFGKLPNLKLGIGLGKNIDLFNLDKLIDSFNFSGLNIKLPNLSFATLEKLEVTLPGFGGGELDLSKLSGLARIKFDFGKIKGLTLPELDLTFVDGKLNGKLSVSVDIGQIFKFLTGKLTFTFDSSLPSFFSLDGTGIGFANPDIGKWAKAALSWLDNKIQGSIKFDKGPIGIKGIKLEITGGEIKIDDLTAVTGWIEVKASGEKNSATGKVIYDKEGNVTLEGKFDIDLSTIHKELEGTLSLGGGTDQPGAKLSAPNAKFKRAPFDQFALKDVTYDTATEDFSATVEMKKDKFKISVLEVSNFLGSITVNVKGGVLSLGGDVSGDAAVVAGKQSLVEGKFAANYKDGAGSGKITITKSSLKAGSATVIPEKLELLLADLSKLASSTGGLRIKQGKLIDILLTANVAGGELTGFDVKGEVGATKLSKKAKIDGTFDIATGALKVSTEIELELGDLVEKGQGKVTLGYDDKKGFSAELKKTTLAKGPLSGWSLSGGLDGEGHLTGALEAADTPIALGPVLITVDAGSKLTLDTDKGVAGDISGAIKFGKRELKLKVHFDTSEVKEVKPLEKTIDIGKIIKPLAGTLTFTYVRGKADPITIEGVGIKPAKKELADLFTANVKFDKGHLTGDIKIKNASTKVLGMSVTLESNTLKFIDEDVSGAASFAISSKGGKNGGHLTVEYKDGDLTFGGDVSIDLSTIATWLSGTLKADGATGAGMTLKADGAKINKKPFDNVTLDEVTYATESGDFSAKITVAKDTLKFGSAVELKEPTSTLKVARTGKGDVTIEGSVTSGFGLKVGKQVGEGSLSAKYEGGKFSGTLTIDKATIEVKPATITPENLVIHYSEDGKLSVTGKAGLRVKYGKLVDLMLTVQDVGDISKGFSIAGTIGETKLTHKVDIKSFVYKPDGTIEGDVEIELKDLGGLLDPKTTFKLGYHDGVWTAHVDKITINKGLLKGWSFSGGLTDGKFAGTITAPALDFKVGTAKVKVAAGASLGFDEDKGISGDVKGDIELMSGKKIGVAITVTDGKLTKASGSLSDISVIVPPVTGSLEASYNNGDIRIAGSGITLKDEKLAKYASIDDFLYEKGELSGTVSFKTGPFSYEKLFSGQIHAGKITLKAGKWSGEVALSVASEAAGAAATGKIIVDEAGNFKVVGKAELDVGKMSKGYLTGKLTADNTDGLSLAGKIHFAKGPLASIVKEISASYVSAPAEKLTAGFELGADDLNKKISGVTIGALTLKGEIEMVNGVVKLKDLDTKATLSVGKYFDGSIRAGYKDGNFFGEVTATESGLKLNLPKAKLSLDKFKVLINDLFKLVDGNFAIGINVADFVTGELKLGVHGGAITGFDFDGKVAGTAVTKPVEKLNVHYKDGKWSGETKIHFNALGGVLDDGASLTLAGSDAGISVKADKVKFQKGVLKGFEVSGHFDSGSGDFGGSITGAGEVSVGSIKATVTSGNIAFSKKDGLSGAVEGNLKLGAADVNFSIGGKDKDVKVEVKEFDLNKVHKILKGKITATYDKGDFSFVAKEPGLGPPLEKVEKVIKFNHVKYHGGNWDISVSAVAGAKFNAGSATNLAEVIDGHLDWNKGNINGEIHGKLGDVKVKVGFKNGTLILGAGMRINLADADKFAGKAVGVVEAEGDTSGQATFKILEDVHLTALKEVKITSLSGNLEAKKFKVGIDGKDLQNKISIPLLKLDSLDASGHFAYDNGAISVEGAISGTGKIEAGGKTLVSGGFGLTYDNTNGLGGWLSVKDVPISDKLKPKTLKIDYHPNVKTEVSGSIDFEIPKVMKGNIAPVVDLKSNKFDFALDANFIPPALKDIAAHVEYKDGNLDVSIKLEGAKTIKLPGGASLTLEAGSTLSFINNQLNGDLKGSAKLGNIATGKFDIKLTNGVISGDLDMTINKIPTLKEGIAVKVSFDDGKLSTKAPVELELQDTYKKYIDGKLMFEVHDNKITAGGEIKALKNLGSLNNKLKAAEVHYDVDKQSLNGSGTVDISALPAIGPGSTLTLKIIDNKLGIAGDVNFKKFGGADVTGALQFAWEPGKYFIKGKVSANLKNLALLELEATTGKDGAEGGNAAFDDSQKPTFAVKGKLTVQGLMNRFPQIKFSKAPSVSFWAQTSEDGNSVDYGMDDFSTSIIGLPGVDKCNIDLAASYKKDKGFDAKIAIHDLQVKMFKLGGSLSIKESKFEEATLTMEADIPSVNLDGKIKVHAGEMDKLNAEAEVTAKPKGGSALSWLESGNVKVGVKNGALDSASGKIILKKPPLLNIDKTTIEVSKQGEDIVGSLEANFKVPFQDGKDGKFRAWFGGPKKWEISIEADLKVPGFKKGHIGGKADGNGDFEVHGSLEGDGGRFIQAASMRFGYKKGGFFFGGSVTLKITDDLSGTVDVEYDAGTDDFLFKGVIRPIQKAPDKSKKPIFHKAFHTLIPLASIGVASVGITVDAGFDVYYILPYMQFRELKLEGSLKDLQSGKLPKISVSGAFGMGVGASVYLGIGVGVKVDLGFASATAGIRGKFTASIDLTLDSVVTGTMGGDTDGLDIHVDTSLKAELNLKAALEAFLEVESWFGDWETSEELASMQFGPYGLPPWKPLKPFTYNIGGSKPGFKEGPETSGEAPDVDSAVSKAGDAANDPDARTKEDLKPKVREIMQRVKAAGDRFEKLPEGWQEKGLTQPNIDVASLVGVDDKAWDFYQDHGGEAEEWFPEFRLVTPSEKVMKKALIYGRINPQLAGMVILGYQRAQIASLGFNPDTGADVVAERGQVQAMQDEQYAQAMEAWAAATKAQMDEWTAHVHKQQDDYTTAEAEHHKKSETVVKEHDAKVSHLNAEAKAAGQKVEVAADKAKAEGVKDINQAEVKAPPPAAPTLPKTLPPLAKPAPILPPPPLPIPIPPAPIPAVTIPPAPTGPESIWVGKAVPKAQAGPAPAAPKSAPDPAGANPPDSEAAAKSATGGPAKQVNSGGGGSGAPPKKGATFPKGPGGGPGGGGDPNAKLPGNIAQQGAFLDKKLVDLGGKAKPAAKVPPAAAPGGAAVAPSAGAAAAAGPGGAAAPGGKAQPGGKGKPGDKGDHGAAPAGPLDPSVQKVVAQGKADEEKQAAQAKTDEVAYKQKVDSKKQVAGAAEAKLEEKTKVQKSANETKAALEHDKKDKPERKMPDVGVFPLPTPDNVRVAYSNWSRLKLSGETLASFREKHMMRGYFDFGLRTWANVYAEYKKLFEKAKPEDKLPDPQPYAEKMYAGHSFVAGDFKKAPAYDPAFSLSDEAIKALEALHTFKDNYKGNPSADYLVTEAEKMLEAQRTAFVHTVLEPIAGSLQPQKALRAAIERLGPITEVREQLGQIDAGQGIEPAAFWGLLAQKFNTAARGITQIADARATLDAKKQQQKPPEQKDAKGAGPGAPAEAAPQTLKWADVKARFDALAGDVALETLVLDFGVKIGDALASNQAAVMAVKKREIEELAKTSAGKKPEEIHEAWKTKRFAQEIQFLARLRFVSKDYASLISELRAKEPRLDADGVAQACAAFRKRVGSNTLAFSIPVLNPPGLKAEELVDSPAYKVVDGADWNPLIEPAFLRKFEAFDPALFPVAAKAEKKEEAAAAADPKAAGADPKAAGAADPKANGAGANGAGPKPAAANGAAQVPAAQDAASKPGAAGAKDPAKDPAAKDAAAPKDSAAKDPALADPKAAAAAGAKPADSAKPDAVDAEALKAADAKLKLVFQGCALPPTKLATTPDKERIDLAAKPDADIRKQFFADFESLVPSMNALQTDKVNQLGSEEALEEGTKDDLVKKFKETTFRQFIDEGKEMSATFIGAVRAADLTFKGRKLDKASLDAAVPDDKSLARVVGIDAIERNLDVGAATSRWLAVHLGETAPEENVIKAWAILELKKTPSLIKTLVKPSLVTWAGWVFPDPTIKADAVFSEYCDLLALYANWYPQGQVRMNLKRESVLKAIDKGNLRKPTVFDGMQSPLWVQRDNRDHNWGKTGGGLREALMQIEWDGIDHATWQVVEIDPKYQAVLDATNKTAAANAAQKKDATKPGADPKDGATVKQHEQAQLADAQKTQAAQTKEDAAAKNAGGPPPSGGGAPPPPPTGPSPSGGGAKPEVSGSSVAAVPAVGPATANAPVKSADAAADAKKTPADGEQKDPPVPKTLVAAPISIDEPTPALRAAAASAKDGDVLYDNGADAKVATKRLLAEHKDAQLDEASGALKLPAVQQSAFQSASSLKDVGEAVAKQTGVSRVAVRKVGDTVQIEGQINPFTVIGKLTVKDLTPDPGEKILLLGEADFSFARALASQLKSSGVVATSNEKKAGTSEHKGKVTEYSGSKENIEAAQKDGAQIVAGVDAREIDPNLGGPPSLFQYIVFNFPMIIVARPEIVQTNKKMIAAFLQSASRALKPGGKVFLTSKEGNLVRWDLKAAATAAGLKCETDLAEKDPTLIAKEFDSKEFPPYQHRETHKDKSAGDTEKGLTVVFTK